MVNGVYNLSVGGRATCAMADIYLPPTMVRPFTHMLRPELEAWVSGILSKETGKSRITDYTKVKQPQWWPKSVPFSNPSRDPRKGHARLKGSWSDSLRTVLRNYYIFYRHYNLLGEDACPEEEDDDEVTFAISDQSWESDDKPWRQCTLREDTDFKVYNMMDGSVVNLPDDSSDQHKAPYASSAPMEAAVPGNDMSAAGPLPARIFKHSQSPDMPSQQGSSMCVSPNEAAPASGDDEVYINAKHDVVEVFICFFCEREFGERLTLQRHQQYCTMRPAELVSLIRPKTVPRPELRSRTRPKLFPPRKSQVKEIHPDLLPRVEKRKIVEALGLLPKANAERLKQQRKKVHVETIKIDVDTPKSPTTPVTPKTPKSLMSQLSRDVSPLGRMKCRESVDLIPSNEMDEDLSDDESVNSSTDLGYQPRRTASLFNIDLTSALGQRVKKLLVPITHELSSDEETDDESNKNYEKYCRTPVKSGQLSKLRHRGNQFPVTFRKTKRTAPSHYFRYAFTARDRREHYRILATGLNKRARALKRLTEKCTVGLERLSEEELRRWRKRSVMRSPVPYADLLSMSNSSKLLLCGKPSSMLPHGMYNLPSNSELLHKLLHGTSNKPKPPLRMAGIPSPTPINGSLPPAKPSSVHSSPSDNVQVISPKKSQAPLLLREMLQNPGTQHVYKGSQKINQNHSTLVNSSPDINKSIKSDDIISISSDEDDEQEKNTKRKREEFPPNDHPQAKRRRIEELRTQPLMFRCHLCQAEITCKENATVIIKRHFTKTHHVYNIDLLEHTEPSGQRVISIVELPRNHIPSPRASATPLKALPKSTSLNSLHEKHYISPKSTVSPSQFYPTPPSQHTTNSSCSVLPIQSSNNNNNNSKQTFAAVSTFNQHLNHQTTRARRGLFQECPNGMSDTDCNGRTSNRLSTVINNPRPKTRSNGKVEVICLD